MVTTMDLLLQNIFFGQYCPNFGFVGQLMDFSRIIK